MNFPYYEKEMPARGRPKIASESVRRPLSIRITDAEKQMLAVAANAAGQKLTEWARKKLLDAAAGDNS